jgi:hypothetical protein
MTMRIVYLLNLIAALAFTADMRAQPSSPRTGACTLKRIESYPEKLVPGEYVRNFFVTVECQREEQASVRLWFTPAGGTAREVAISNTVQLRDRTVRVPVRGSGFQMAEGCFQARLNIRGGEAALSQCTVPTELAIRYVEVRQH